MSFQRSCFCMVNKVILVCSLSLLFVVPLVDAYGSDLDTQAAFGHDPSDSPRPAMEKHLELAGSSPDPSATVANLPVLRSVTRDSLGTTEIVIFSVDGVLDKKNISVFSTLHPYRLVMDFFHTRNAVVKEIQGKQDDFLQKVMVASNGNRTRAVLVLSGMNYHRVTYHGRHIVVEVSKKPLEGAVSWSPHPVRHDPHSDQTRPAIVTEHMTAKRDQLLENVSFRRGEGDEANIVLKFQSSIPIMKLQRDPHKLSIFFPFVYAQSDTFRTYDVTDFNTPVASFSLKKVATGIEVVVLCQTAWSDTTYQIKNSLTIKVRKKKNQLDSLGIAGDTKIYTGKKLSLNFQDTPIRSALQAIADFTGMNILVANNVVGRLTIRLEQTPWDQALDIILQSAGLGMRHYGTVLSIAPQEDLLKKDEALLESAQQVSNLAPLFTQSFHMSYQKVDDVQKILTSPGSATTGGAANVTTGLLSKRGSVIVDVRTNQLFLQDTAANIERIARFIASIDIPVAQVMIEARIVEANQNFSRTLGVRLGVSRFGRFRDNGAAIVPTWAMGPSNEVNTGNMKAAAIDPTLQTYNVNLPSTGADSYEAGKIAWTLFNAGRTSLLNLELSALEADGNGRVLSNPRVVTSDKTQAIIEQGTEIPYTTVQTSGGSVVSTTSFRSANLSLKVTPQITPNNKITMDIEITKDTVGSSTAAGISIDTKHVKTAVLIENGGTLMVGGIFTKNATHQLDKIPFLGDLPIIGALFRQIMRTQTQQELLVFITPRIVNNAVAHFIP